MISDEPANKKMKMDGDEEEPLAPKTKHINNLQPENLGQILGRSGLTVIDRLHCTRVSRHWKWAVGEFAWTHQKKISIRTVFEGVSEGNFVAFFRRFWLNAPKEGSCNLVSLLNHIAKGPFNNLVELDLHSFGSIIVEDFVPQIVENLPAFAKLKKLEGLNLAEFVKFLPSSLHQIQILETAVISMETLEQLAVRCPNLQKVPFNQVDNITLDIVNAYLLRFPRQRALDLADEVFESKNGSRLSAISELKQLEMLHLRQCDGIDAESFRAIIVNCQSLRKLELFDISALREASLLLLSKLPNLEVLEILSDSSDGRAFTDAVLRGIARRGKLKRLQIASKELTDVSILFLVDQCKSLVSLEFYECPEITVRSLEAVISEVQRRYGSPPRSLPTGPLDSGMFYFDCYGTEIEEESALELIAGNPWISLHFDGNVNEPRELVF